MTTKQVQKLDNGLYILLWKSGGLSYAAVGSCSNGDKWMAPTNWVTICEKNNKKNWRDVKSVIRI